MISFMFQPPASSGLKLIWDGSPIEFYGTVGYVCSDKNVFFEMKKDLVQWNVTCLPGGSWDKPKVWPNCVPCKLHKFKIYFQITDSSLYVFICLAINCTDPPQRPPSGTWEWNKSYAYNTQILYTCGPFGNFKSPSGKLSNSLVSTCAWNKTWVPPALDPCQGVHKEMFQKKLKE